VRQPSRSDAAGSENVVFLDQNPVIEAEAVIAAATASDRVLLCQAQTGNRLARVYHLRPRTGDQVGVLPGFAGNPGKQLQEVERTALAGEQGARRSLDFAEQLIRADALAISAFQMMAIAASSRVKQRSNQAVPQRMAFHGQ
jgi:hypothetical protein